MFKNQVKQLLLKLAAIDAIVLDFHRDEALVINNTIEKLLKTQIEIVERQVQTYESVRFTNNFGQNFRRNGAKALFAQTKLTWTLLEDNLSKPCQLQLNVSGQLQVFLTSDEKFSEERWKLLLNDWSFGLDVAF